MDFDFITCRFNSYHPKCEKEHVYSTLLMDYAIAALGGRQYIIKSGSTACVNFFKNCETYSYCLLKKILLYKNKNNIQIGKPFLKHSYILCRILQHLKGKKIAVVKTKPKKHYLKTRGNRSCYTRIQVV